MWKWQTVTPETVVVANSLGLSVPIVIRLPPTGLLSIDAAIEVLRNVSSYEPDSIFIYASLPYPDIPTCANLVKAFAAMGMICVFPLRRLWGDFTLTCGCHVMGDVMGCCRLHASFVVYGRRVFSERIYSRYTDS